MQCSVLYVTFADRAAALEIGRTLVHERIVACANVIDGMTSVYRWDGAIELADEVLLLLKTRQELVESVIDRVRQLHSYDVPCITSWPIEQGNADYLQWILDETRYEDRVERDK